MLISVCIPTYSRLQYLQETVDSIVKQTYPLIETCIALDPKPDGPDKSIFDWCTQLVAQNPAIKFGVNQSNLGLAGNWNQLARMATGEYIIILGDDDKLAPDYIARMVHDIRISDADVCFCDQYFIDAKGTIDYKLTEENTIRYGRSEMKCGLLEEPVKTVLQNSVPMSSSVIKSNWLHTFSFDPGLNTPELEVFLKIAVAGGKFYYEDQRLAFYRVHSISATSSGLTVHRFVTNIIDIPVPPAYEVYKQELISGQIRVGVNRYLLEADKRNARKLLNSKYYPANQTFYKLFQTLLLYTPTVFIRWLRNSR